MTYPTLSERPDQSTYYYTQEDPAIRSEMEGGYVTSRPRFLRNPRKTFYFGYKTLPDADYKLLEQHWIDTQGGSLVFQYVDWHDGRTYDVRYKERWRSRFVGAGQTRWWDITGIVLEEA